MRCPYCGKDEDKVVDSRPRDDGRAIRRRRSCLKCGRRFTTIEEIEDKTLYVIKSDGRREIFQRAKLLKGIQTACTKRPVPIEDIEALVERIEVDLENKGVKEVKSRELGELVSVALKALDEVAYVRFASVYRNFKDKDEFLQELRELKTDLN